jgi:hypothetical protein
MEYEIRFKDIDPDSGEVSQDVMLATSENEMYARWIVHSLGFDNAENGDPNREFYIRVKATIIKSMDQ